MMFVSRARGIFDVKGDSGNDYVTDIENNTCTCKSWILGKNRPCKHLAFLGVKHD